MKTKPVKNPKKKLSQPPRPHIEIIERDPNGPVDLADFKTKPSQYWEDASKRAKP